ncbi:P-loop NTPase fold protein [Eudoraea adriatica]|uniref:P-loop NTPase fold protein n=1 Tax=Eudoraea adriatica TaxID=446681 RepID=UPI00036BC262|nr:P-loop NTPase fold protein [Eudoraea adriatica]
MEISPLSIPIESFEKHLTIEKNERILFSGIFGIGKTWFLNKFFNENEKYIKIHLFPINYSVSSNNDIFELIKTDILLEILNLNIAAFSNAELPLFLKLQGYVIKTLDRIIPSFIENISHLGESASFSEDESSFIKLVSPLVRFVNESKDKYSKYDKKIEENQELKVIKDYLDQNIEKPGNIYENNVITQIIYQLIEEVKEKTSKNVVLIIDDLDRLDPSDIFRLLNIFSAHFDANTMENKFGLDKVIFVADVKNLKSIYKHKYGPKTDFNGYLNKFYSRSIFYYDNEENISSIIGQFVDSINDYSINIFGPWMKNLLRMGLKVNYINLRILLSFDNSSIVLPSNFKFMIGERRYPEEHFPYIKFHFIMAKILDGGDNFIEMLDTIKDVDNMEMRQGDVTDLKHLIPILDIDNIVFNGALNSHEKESLKCFIPDFQQEVIYTTRSSTPVIAEDIIVKEITRDDHSYSMEAQKINLMYFMKKTSEKIRELKLIK